MPDANIRNYLNHHLAASVAWLEAVERLEAAEQGTPTGRALTELRAQGEADRRVLEEFMARLGVGESGAEKATAWLGEKFSRLLFPLDERKGGPLNQFLALEALSLGLEGRRALWLALSAAAQETEFLRGPDYRVLVRRAEEQRERMERLRLAAAAKALHRS